MTSAQSPSSFRMEPNSNNLNDNIQNHNVKFGIEMSSPQRHSITDRNPTTLTPEHSFKINQKNIQKGVEDNSSAFNKFILESSLEKPSGIKDLISNYKSSGNMGFMMKKDLKGPFSSPSFQEGKTDLNVFKKTGSLAAAERPKNDIASALNQIIQAKKLESNTNNGSPNQKIKSLDEEIEIKKNGVDKKNYFKSQNIKSISVEEKICHSNPIFNTNNGNNRTHSITNNLMFNDKSAISKAFEDLENYRSEKITANINESAKKRDYRSADYQDGDDSSESKDSDFCKKHPRKRAKYYIKGKEDAKFCSKCALLVAMNGDLVEKFLSREENLRKKMTEEFLTKVRTLKENIVDLENLLKKQKADSETFSTGQREKILQVFLNLEEMIRAKKEACLHQLELKVNSTQNYLETRLSLIGKYRYELERFNNDVNQNFENIIKNIQMTPFREIMKKYNDKVSYLERSLLDFHKSPIELLICKENSEKLNLIRDDLKHIISIETVIPLDSNFGSFSAAPKIINETVSGRKSSGKKKSLIEEETLNHSNKENISVLANLKLQTNIPNSLSNMTSNQFLASSSNVRSSKGSPLNTITLTLTEEARENSNRNLHNRPKKRPQPQYNTESSTFDHNISNCTSQIRASPGGITKTMAFGGEKGHSKKQNFLQNGNIHNDTTSFKMIDEGRFMVSKQNLRNSLERKNLTVNNESSVERSEISATGQNLKLITAKNNGNSGRGNSWEREPKQISSQNAINQKDNNPAKNSSRENNENKDLSNIDNNSANISCLNSLKSSLLVNRGKSNSKTNEEESLLNKAAISRGRREGSPVGTIYTQILNSLRNETKRSPSESSNKSGSPDERLLGGLGSGFERKNIVKAQVNDANKGKKLKT